MMNAFGQELRAMRMRRSLTLKDVAAAAGRSVSSISDIEHSRRPPLSAGEIESVCDKLKIRSEMDGLLEAACHNEGTVKLSVETPLEKDLFVTLKRSIDGRLLKADEIKKLIDGLKEKLDAKDKSSAADGAGNGVN
jgi:transcriptional regulator with XRE-family HTH domain